MTDLFPPAAQRPKLLAFAEACCTRAGKLRRDECGDWAIFGKHGHVYAVPEGYQLMIFKGSATGWTHAKQQLVPARQRLAFGRITQDGDTEGAVVLDRPPVLGEAQEIRMVLGIPKRVQYGPEALAMKRAQALMAREKRQPLPAPAPW